MWEFELFEKYPKTFQSLDYVECNEGWKEIVDQVSFKIEQVNNKYPGSSYIHASQIKQKFGGLRYYVSFEDINNDDVNYVYSIIEEAEKRSLTICEICGAPGKRSKQGYYMETVCDEHNNTNR